MNTVQKKGVLLVDHKMMLVIGNGNSARHLAKIGFENIPDHIDTFGMGLSHRLFAQIGWWPTFYACCDMKVVHSNQEEFKNLIIDPEVLCEKFYFPLHLVDSPKLSLIPHSSTGDFCVKESVRLGYTYIMFIGMDRDYQEVIPQARELTSTEFEELGFTELLRDTNPKKVGRELLIIDEDPVINTNYFFDSYQRKGDVYSLPKAGTSHASAWEKLYKLISETDSDVFDLSPLRQDIHAEDVSLKEIIALNKSDLQKKLSAQAIRATQIEPNNIGLLRRWFGNR